MLFAVPRAEAGVNLRSLSGTREHPYRYGALNGTAVAALVF
jgi:hypothetical protein